MLDRRLVPFAVVGLTVSVLPALFLPWPQVAIVSMCSVALYMVVYWWGAGRLIPVIYRACPLERIHPDLAEAFGREIVGWAKELRMTPPRLYLLASPFSATYAAGGSRVGAIMVTTGLLESCSYSEIKALLAHEMVHLREGDSILSAAAAHLNMTAKLVSGLLACTSTSVLWLVAGLYRMVGDRRQARFTLRVSRLMATRLVTGTTQRTARLMAWASRDAELAADRGGAQLAGRDNMLIAVVKLSVVNRLPVGDVIGQFFNHHPSVEARVEALQALGPRPSEAA